MTATFFEGDARVVLREFPDNFFHCVVTSPPYLGLRSYDGGVEVWGGDENCEHEWCLSAGKPVAPVKDNSGGFVNNRLSSRGTQSWSAGVAAKVPLNGFCLKCGAWRGQLGAEPTPELYIQHLIQVMREVRRVLRPDGVFWLNIGDSWASGKGTCFNPSGGSSSLVGHARLKAESAYQLDRHNKSDLLSRGVKPLDMELIPEQLVLAARADGWYVRSVLIWAKGVSLSSEYNGNPMPECLDPSTRVFVKTQDGWMHRVSLGELLRMGVLPQILSPTGWVSIEHVWSVDKPAMALQVSKVERVICSSDHRFPVSHDRRRVSTELKRASDIRFKGYNDYLLYKAIEEFCPVNIETCGCYSLDYDVGYLVGVYVAEGSTDNRFGNGIQVSLGDHEAELHEKVVGLFSRYGIKVHDDGHKGRRNVFRVYDESFCRLIDAFVTGNAKTKRLSIDLVINSPATFRRGLLDGYLAGDGSGRPSAGWCAASASRRLRDDISTLASSLGIIASKGRQRSVSRIAPKVSVGHTLWTPYINRGEKKGANGVCCIPVRGRTVTRQKSATRRMVDVEVDGGLFLIGDGLVSHNSVNGWRWEKHRVRATDAWQDCLGCSKCEATGGYVLRKGSWRPTDSYEHILMLTKTSSYFCDREAVVERGVYPAGERRSGGDNHKSLGTGSRTTEGLHNKEWVGSGGRNLRSVLAVPTAGSKVKHFAVFSPRLVEPLIKAATSEKGCCSVCGSPWARVVERGGECANQTEAVGWLPTCSCNTQHDPVPCWILDPFCGSGTVSLVCERLGLDSVGIDTSAKYIRFAEDRLAEDARKRGP